MKKTAVAAAVMVGVGVSAVSGAAALPGSAANESQLRTRNLVLHETAFHGLGKYTFAGTDRAGSNGETVGYDSYTGHYFPKTEKSRIQFALALKGGIIVGYVNARQATPEFAGVILKGSGKYAGVEGTITGRFTSGKNDNRTFVTLRYHL